MSTAARRRAYAEILRLLREKELPQAYPPADENRQLGPESLQFRQEILGLCGYCLLSYDWLRPLAAWIGQRRCLEIMCGSGALSCGLQRCGVDIRATDDLSWAREHAVSWFEDAWTEITPLPAREAIARFGAETDLVICAWPFLDESCCQALLQLRAVHPAAMLLYIGEWRGASASDSFFDAARPVPSASFARAVAGYTRFYGLRDWPYLLR